MADPKQLISSRAICNKLNKLAEEAEITQIGKLSRFLESNTRRDRDALIKSREKVITLKNLKDVLFQ